MEKIKLFLIELWVRLKSRTPKFWKQIQLLSASVGALAYAIIQVDLDINTNITSTLNYVVFACIIIAGTAQFTKEDKK
jgi:hypothetical protein